MHHKSVFPTCFSVMLLLLFSCNNSQEHNANSLEQYLALSLEERQMPQHATEAFEVAEGLEVQLFASEPMVINPTNMAIDEKGRIWVCESYNYAVPENEQQENGGRITILEDTDGDGKADARKVFYQGDDVNIALGISVFGDRVFVARSPNMLVFTDSNHDDIPDKKEILFSGMGKPGDHSAHAVIFGPDGRFYFNYGNAGSAVFTASGDTIVGIDGNKVLSNGHPFHGGMVFRFDQDGGNFEVLGHNFRNNYEVAIDAYGTLWQSDNDDDGNQGVRINYVMEFGNFGYLDEFTGAHWTTPRTGMSDEIPKKHWHQNDPGVIPNLLYTGAGSPAGIVIYEGNLLPEIFQNQIIHADAGPNVVRAYPVKETKAGYTADLENILKSHADQWFRPVDVAVAPDGSLFVADWYDPIVGGGAAGDREKGRIFRIAPPSKKYKINQSPITTVESAAKYLNNPNEAVRYLAWQLLKTSGLNAEPALKKVWKNGSSRQRARALWLLGQLPSPQGLAYLNEATHDEDAQIRIVAIRLARLLNTSLPPYLKQLVHDPSAAVRREVAIALHYEKGAEAAQIWADLAAQHDGDDRWYLEALGIGAKNNWELCYGTWEKLAGEQWNTPGGRDIVWRSRTKEALPKLTELILDQNTSFEEKLRYFRAFDFHREPSKNDYLIAILEQTEPISSNIKTLALQHLNADAVHMTPALEQTIEEALETIKETWQYVDVVAKFNLTNKKSELLELASKSSENEIGSYAARLLTNPETFNGISLIRKRIFEDEKSASSLIHAIQFIGRKETLALLKEVALNDKLNLNIRKDAVQGMGKTWSGENYLLETVKNPNFPESLKPLASSILFSVYRTSIHEEAAKYLKKPEASGNATLPPIRVLIATDGNVERGKQVFQSFCQTCHIVDGEGVKFGPELSLIGDKLSREGLYRSIIYPGEGVNYGYQYYGQKSAR